MEQGSSLILLTFCFSKYIVKKYQSVQFSRSVMSDSVWPHGLQHARLPCPSASPRACSNSCPWSGRCHPAVSSSVVPFCIMRGHHWEHFKCTILSKGCVHMAVRVQEVRKRGVYKRCVHMAVRLSAPSVSTTFHLPNRTRYPWRADSLLTPAPCEPHLIFYLWEFDCSRCLI